MRELRGRHVLITGATGFIGGRLAEKLVLGKGAKVRALVSSFTRCARIARFPIEFAKGDLLDREAVMRAAQGCDVIFHCAYGSRGRPEERRRVTIEGTANVLAAATAVGARVVHLSTQMVYGVPDNGEIVEDLPRRRTGSSYGDSKLEAEERVLRAASQGLSATVLQPTAVYGPHAPVWTVGVLERMRAGRVPLIAGGEGSCNAVYVDDVVDAMQLAAMSDEARGECFLISAAGPVTWRDFYGRYEAMLGVPATVPVTTDQAWFKPQRRRSIFQELPAALLQEPSVRSRLGRTVEGRVLARLLRRLKPNGKPPTATPELDRLRRLRPSGSGSEERQTHSLEPSDVAFFASRARVSIDKAERILGYRPAYGLEEGMELTGAWARWAGLVPATGADAVAVSGRA